MILMKDTGILQSFQIVYIYSAHIVLSSGIIWFMQGYLEILVLLVPRRDQLILSLTLKAPNKNCSRRHIIFFYLDF